MRGPPVITTQPKTDTTESMQYTQPIVATDPQGQSITYSFASYPVGMTIDSHTGIINWLPQSTGYAVITVVATNQSGKTSSLTYTLNVHSNIAPYIYSPVPTDPQVTAGTKYEYDVQVLTHNDTVTYQLDQAPAGMTLDSLGRLIWTPTTSQVGPATVSLHATNGGGLPSQEVTFTVNVVHDTTPPTVSLQFLKPKIPYGASVTALVSATDNVGVATTSLTVNGQPVKLDTARRCGPDV